MQPPCCIIMPLPVRKGAISVAFVRPSVCPSVDGVEYIANNSITQRLSVSKFGRKLRFAYQFQGQKVKGQGHQAH